MSSDPISQKYPWYTPYQFAGNKPIKFIDLDGLEEGQLSLQSMDLGNRFLDEDRIDAITKEQYIDIHKVRGVVGAGGLVLVTGGLVLAEGGLPLYLYASTSPEFAPAVGGFIWGLGTDQDVPGLVTDEGGRVVRKSFVELKETLRKEGALLSDEAAALIIGKGTNGYIGKSRKSLLSSKASYEELIIEHQQKIDDFIADPIGNTSPARLIMMKIDNPSPEELLRRAMGRVGALQKQLRKQMGELDKINEALDKIE